MRLSTCAGAWVLMTLLGLPTAQAVVVDLPTEAPQTEYFSLDVGRLAATFDKSHIVSDPAIIEASFYQMDSSPRVVVPAGVEAYLLEAADRNKDYLGYRIIGRKPAGEPIEGKFFTLRRHPDHPQENVLAKFEFQVNAQPQFTPSRADFFRAKGRHFQRWWNVETAGAAMFRHLATTALKEVGEAAKSVGPEWPLSRNMGVDATIALMSGGRAVSENLQLDTQLALPDKDSADLKPLSAVRGITIREINWNNLLQKVPTELDALSKMVPHDQYALYLPSFQALAEIVDRGGEIAKPAVPWFEPQSRKTDVIGFYQTQLALPLNALTRQIGKTLIGEVALTGSDPYFRTGTDLAVLMQSDQPDRLHQMILAQVTAQTKLHRNVKRVEHRVDGHVFTSWSTDNRKLCSYVCRVDDGVVVCNSLPQMMQVLKCADGRQPTMHDLDEYRFFRQRYPRGEKAESALLVVTDAAIRRWCSPQWRIAASRRTRARATIAELTMRYADDLVAETITAVTQIHAVSGMPDVGSMLISADGVHSEVWGTLDFQTPIAELNTRYASTAEIKLYEGWRTRYERRWRQTFDPIALQLSLSDKTIDADLSVIPLMIQSEYRQYTQIAGNQRLKPDAGDAHPESLAEFTIALDTKAMLMQIIRMALANGGSDIDFLAWIDGSASLYFDFDQQWMKEFENRSPWAMSSDSQFQELPIGLFIPSKDNLRMTAFLVAVRSTVQRYAPNMFRWESVQYRDHEYVVGTVIQGTALGRAEDMPKVYYVTSGKGLTVSANRGVIERTIDRHLIDKKPQEPQDVVAETDLDTAPQVIMRTSGKGVGIMTRTNYRNGLRRMHQMTWSNIPILNYLRSRYPDRDPQQVYEQLFGQTVVEPGGGQYVWNEDRETYVSTRQGYHLEPQAGPVVSPFLGPHGQLTATISFQDGGLRATLQVQEN